MRLLVEMLVVIAVSAAGVRCALPFLLPGVSGGLEVSAESFLIVAMAGPILYWRVARSGVVAGGAADPRGDGDTTHSEAVRAHPSVAERADRRRARIEASIASVLMAVTGGVACLGLWATTRATIQQNVQQELARLACAASSVVDPELHQRIIDPAMIDSPEYVRAVAPLRSLARDVPGVHYVYTMILDGDTPRFVLDAAEPGDHDHDGVEDRAQVLEAYRTAEPALLQALGTKDHPGSTVSTGEPYTDKWGTFITGYAPLLDAGGRQFGIVGVDIDAASYLERLSTARNRALLGTIPAVFLALCMGIVLYVVRVRMLRSVRRLSESEQRFRSTADATPALVWSSGTHGRCQWFNRGWLEFTGRKMEDEVNEGWHVSVHPEDLQQCLATQRSALGNRRPFHREYRLRRADGVYRTMEDRGAPNVSPDGEFLGYVGMAIDITDRLSAERALSAIARTNARLAAAVDAVNDALCVTDTDGCIIYVNRGFERQTGWSHDEVLGLRPSILKSGNISAAVYRDLWSTISSGRPWAGRLHNRRRDPDPVATTSEDDFGLEPSFYWAETTITPLIDAGRRITGYVSLQRDVTQQVNDEEVSRVEAELAEACAAVASILSCESPLRSRLGDVARRLNQVSGSGPTPCAAVLAYDHQGGPLELLVQVGAVLSEGEAFAEQPAVAPVASEAPSRSDLLELCGSAAEKGYVCVSSACPHSHAAGGTTAPIRAHGHFAVPLMHASRCEGVLLLSCDPRPSCLSTRFDALRQIGEILALALVKERAAQFLVDAMKKADAASRSKSEFLANMSHEIRTPLTAILGYAEVLSDEPELTQDPARLRPVLDTMRSAGEHLLSVVNDILDISKIEAGGMAVEAVETNLPELFQDTLALLRPRATARGLELDLRFDTPIPTGVRTDPTRMRQVLMNLAGNALKFTARGGVIVRVAVARPWGETVLTLSVEDTGPGLTAEERTRLFHAFSQGDTSVTRRHGGTGLGLVICKRLAQLMGGDVELTRSQPGVGSVFTATFRILVAPDATLDEVGAPLPTPRSSATVSLPRLVGRILLAEDGRDNQRLISLHLRKAGAEIDVADNGRIALDRLVAAQAAGQPYDLLLTDVQMPEMDGITLTRTLRARGFTIPIVALTAHAMAEDQQRCLEAGFDDFATKPIDKRVLLPKLARLLVARPRSSV